MSSAAKMQCMKYVLDLNLLSLNDTHLFLSRNFLRLSSGSSISLEALRDRFLQTHAKYVAYYCVKHSTDKTNLTLSLFSVGNPDTLSFLSLLSKSITVQKVLNQTTMEL